MKAPAVLALAMIFASAAQATTFSVDMRLTTPKGPGAPIGRVLITDGPNGAVFSLDLMSLPPGVHGFHVHDRASCAPGPDKAGKVVAAGAAGGHLDPQATGVHAGPGGVGHLGDLPALVVGSDGSATQTLTATRIASVRDLKARALMIHAGGDNYSDVPAPLGGGGARLACGVID